MAKNMDVKPKKAKGPIRWEAIIPVTVILVVAWAYFHFFFDLHLRKGLEYLGYQVMGAEVDIAKLETSFWNASLRIQGIEVTDAQKPEKNMLEVGDVRFGVLWDGLLRAKVVVNEMAVEGIKVGTARRHPGAVKPPEPKVAKSDGPGVVQKEAERLQKQALKNTQEQYKDNVLGDIAAILSGSNSQDQMTKIEGTLESKKKLAELDQSYKEKSKAWDQKIKALPSSKDIQSIGDRMNKIKTKDFKNPQEVVDSVNQFQALIKEADEKYKIVQNTANDLNNDFKQVDEDFKGLDALVKKDTANLESRFHIPKLDAGEISKSLFRQYMAPYMAKLDDYRGMAEKYLPPNVLKKDQKEPEPQIQAHPRARGVSYEFGRPNSYPAFWIKKISVSSQAGASPADGNIHGIVTDVTSNQVLVGRPTVADLKGDFPADQIHDFNLKMTLDNTKADSRIAFNFDVGSYPVNGREVVQSPDVKLAFKNAAGKIVSQGELVALHDLKMHFKNTMTNVAYDVQAQNATVQEILSKIFAGIPTVNIDADISGDLPEVKVDINSNLGGEISKGFQAQINKKVEETKAKIQAYINEQVGQNKAKLESEINKYKNQINGEVKKVQDQLNGQKKQAESKIDASKKQSENQAKQKLQDGVQKAAEDLKKKFGL